MANIELEIVQGPPTGKVSKEEAEHQLKQDPRFPKGASVELKTVEGRWVAAIAKQAGPPFPPSGDDAETDGAPTPPVDEAPSDAPEEEPEGAEPKPKSDKPEGEKKDKGGKGDIGAQIDHLTQLVTTLVDALGLGAGPVDSPVPGPDEGPPVPPAGPPHGTKGPAGPGAGRPLHPGDAPNKPGVVPVGAPAFSHAIPDDHPWKREIEAGVHTLELEERIGDDERLAGVAKELKTLANPWGYRVDQLREGTDATGHRVASAVIVRS